MTHSRASYGGKEIPQKAAHGMGFTSGRELQAIYVVANVLTCNLHSPTMCVTHLLVSGARPSSALSFLPWPSCAVAASSDSRLGPSVLVLDTVDAPACCCCCFFFFFLRRNKQQQTAKSSSRAAPTPTHTPMTIFFQAGVEAGAWGLVPGGRAMLPTEMPGLAATPFLSRACI